MTWEPCLDEPCWPPLTSGGGMTVPELRPVKIWSDKITIRECVKLPCDCTVRVWQRRINLLGAFIACNCSSY